LSRIKNDVFVQWLEDRDASCIGTIRDVLLERVRPPLYPDISIFGKSLVDHRLHVPSSVTFEILLDAYDHAIQATAKGSDPIAAMARVLPMAYGRARDIFSGHRAHPLDEMKYVAQAMIHVIRRNFPEIPIAEDDIVYLDKKPAVGVGDMIYSGFSPSLPVRNTADALRETSGGVRIKISKAWHQLYYRHAFDEDALRVLDVLSTSSSAPHTLLFFNPKKNLRNRRRVVSEGERLAPSIETLQYLESKVFNSDAPIVELYKMLVPVTLSSREFKAQIGNPYSQPGAVRQVTMDKIVMWLEMQKHNIEQSFSGAA